MAGTQLIARMRRTAGASPLKKSRFGMDTKRLTIAAAAGQLQRDELIEYSRGRIHIRNRKKLEALACDCYATVREIHRGLYQH